MANNDGTKKTMQPVPKEGSQSAEFRQTEQNTDGSTTRQDRVYRFTGEDVTPTFDVAAEFDEIIRVIAHEFPEGVTATLQAVFGHNSGTNFTDVIQEGLPVELTAEHSVFTIPYTGRYRFLFKGGWENAEQARISIVRQERIPSWEAGAALVWEPADEWQCRADGLYEKEVNQHGRVRWVKRSDDCMWVGTGELQCRADGLYEREINKAGDVRWTKIADDCGWVGTGELQCRVDGLYERERNRAGDYRWVLIAPDCGWVGTGELQCRADGLYEREVNRAGDYRWTLIDDDCGWVGTGELACEEDGLYERERNRAGDYRWVLIDDDCGWVGTGELQCRPDGLYERQVNRAGGYQWVQIAPDCGWQATGERECRDNVIWQQERNRAGDIRWTETEDTCYDPTYPLPCGGWAFGPGDVRDPEASLELEDCVDGIGQGIWVYPTAGPGHTFPVYDCVADFYCLDPADIEGYAANQTITGIRNKCYDGTSTGCNGDAN